MVKANDTETKANKYAAQKLRDLRGSESRLSFGPKVNCTESMIFAYETEKTRLTVGKLAYVAKVLGVPVSTFFMPDDKLDETNETTIRHYHLNKQREDA